MPTIFNPDLGKLADARAKVAIAKHLCGEATDLAIRGATKAKNVVGLLIAR